MSATNRGAERRPHDFYATPPDITQQLTRWLHERELDDGGSVLDPAAGEGAILRVFEDGERVLHALELRDECFDALDFCDLTHIGDALLPRGVRRGVGPRSKSVV